MVSVRSLKNMPSTDIWKHDTKTLDAQYIYTIDKSYLFQEKNEKCSL